MSDRNVVSWWRSQIPTAVLLLIMIVIVIWSLVGNVGAVPSHYPDEAHSQRTAPGSHKRKER